MQDVFRAAAEVVEHELERGQTWLVGLRLFGGEDLVERRAELVDVGHDLAVAGIGEDHQGNLVGDLRQTGRHVGMGTPGRHCVVIQLAFITVLDAPTFAGSGQGGLENDVVRLPVAHYLIEPVGRKVFDELVHLFRLDAVGKELAGHGAHVEVGERAVAVERNEFGTKKAH
nr:hypothetical protein [Tanacetum cinerariifolium]